MATRDGSLQTGTLDTNVDGTKGRFVYFPASNMPMGLPGTLYKLACVDAAGVRQYWMSHDVALAEAPTGGGVTLPYDTSTLSVIAKVI